MVGVYAGSNRMRVAVIVLGVLLCSATNAEPQSWMKSDDPDTLRYMVDVDSCPISKAALDELVTGILIRSRLKPKLFLDMQILEKGTTEERVKFFQFFQQEHLGFQVFLQCGKMDDRLGSFIYQLDVHFLRYLPEQGRPFYEVPPYGGFGVMNEADIKAEVKERVESLVTDYLKANFDLTSE